MEVEETRDVEETRKALSEQSGTNFGFRELAKQFGFGEESLETSVARAARWDKFVNDAHEAMWYFYQGRKEQRWAPDRRPVEMRNIAAGPGPHSQLNWGGAESREAYKEMKEQQKRAIEDRNKETLANVPLGSSAVALVGESAKPNENEELQWNNDKGMCFEDVVKHAQVPDGEASAIAGPVELAEMIHGKYGRYHDISILHNSGFVAFNIYAPCLGQKSFCYTEEQYLNKLQSVLGLLDELEQTWFVRNFLLSPLKPEMGLPSTPRSDTCVSLRLNLSPTWDDPKHQEIFSAWLALRR